MLWIPNTRKNNGKRKMINVIYQNIVLGGSRVGMTLLESIFFILTFIVIANFINGQLKEIQIQKQNRQPVVIRSLLPTFFIVWPIRLILDTILPQYNIPGLFYAVMATIFFLFYQYFIKKIRDLSEEDYDRRNFSLKKYFRYVLYVCWIWAFISLLIFLFGNILSSITIKIFYLGFFWASQTVMILAGIVLLANKILPIEKSKKDPTITTGKIIINVIFIVISVIILIIWPIIVDILPDLKLLVNAVFLVGFLMYIAIVAPTAVRNISFLIPERIPDKIFQKSIIYASIITFGIWSIQLVILQIFWRILGTILGLSIFITQDIRINIVVSIIIFFISFILVLKKKLLPKASEDSSSRVQNILQEREESKRKFDKAIDKEVILEVKDLVTYFYTEEGIVKAVEGVSFKILQGEVLGLVGETGCGKSVTALSILQLVRPPGKIEKGEIVFLGEDLLKKSVVEMLEYRGNKITMTFQDPLNSVNPVYKVGDQISEVFLLHKYDDLLIEAANNPGESIYSIARKWTESLLKDVEISDPESTFDRYPHELSGGMRQRILIAMALACSPKLLIADEPTTALDVTIQNQILKLFKELKKKYNTSMLFITHDLGIISTMCDRVAVMYSGYIVEYGQIQKLFSAPYHPYTKGLISSIPRVGKRMNRLSTIPGMVPNLIYPPSGCRFHPRCKYCFEPCDSKIPKRIEVDPRYFVACHLFDPEYKDLATIKISEIEK